jgi:hypothetical protein
MEANIESKANIENKTDHEKEGFWHTGWAYLVFLGGLILVFVALYYVMKYFGLT